ncbi:MAG TPA: ParB/RepB/Spo0J family partition protein, partial [Thermodesulfovibrionia bacterium]|nr:ParB/RepB/Spo0J family partition protein [Thermodesulfovibrionia bacterium]
NNEQPRKVFKDNSLQELASSIKEKGVIQPILVTRTDGGLFQIIVGERRWRASKLLGYQTIPAIVKDITQAEVFELALIENIQREDLNPIETAEAFQKLISEYQLTQEDLSQKVGKERATIANYIRILKLPAEIKEWIADGFLSTGHAKAILQIKDEEKQIEIAKKIIKTGLSVRETEKFAVKTEEPKQPPAQTDPHIDSLEERLTSALGTKVRVHAQSKERGKIEILYYSLDELDRLLDILIVEKSV